MEFKKLRKAKDLSQETVAKYAGISLYTYQLIERGITQTPRKESLKLIKEILGNEKSSN